MKKTKVKLKIFIGSVAALFYGAFFVISIIALWNAESIGQKIIWIIYYFASAASLFIMGCLIGKGIKELLEKEEVDIMSDLKRLQDQCDFRKWVESERAEKDLSGKMDFCEKCKQQETCKYVSEDWGEVLKEEYYGEMTERCVCAQNVQRLEKQQRGK